MELGVRVAYPEKGGYQALRHLYGLPEWEPVYPPWVSRRSQ